MTLDSRERHGIETVNRLLNWQKGHTASERLISILLRIDGWSRNDPSQPLGGKDGGVDLACEKDGVKFIVCVYFPRGQQSFSEILSKFKSDAQKNPDQNFILATNQEISLTQRARLSEEITSKKTHIYHNELIAGILNSPAGYGARLEFLDIEMNKEEQASFVAAITETMDRFMNHGDKHGHGKTVGMGSVPTAIPYAINDMSVYGINSRRIEFCTKCQSGFEVNDLALSYSAVNLLSGYAVNCPNCGNIQKYTRRFSFGT